MWTNGTPLASIETTVSNSIGSSRAAMARAQALVSSTSPQRTNAAIQSESLIFTIGSLRRIPATSIS